MNVLDEGSTQASFVDELTNGDLFVALKWMHETKQWFSRCMIQEAGFGRARCVFALKINT